MRKWMGLAGHHRQFTIAILGCSMGPGVLVGQ